MRPFFWIAAAYPEYCSKLGEDFHNARRIPQVSVEAQRENLELIHVSTIVRHGSRTPTGRYDCWKSYQPAWDCMIQTKFVPFMEDYANYTSIPFRKIYDADSASNILGGTCGEGHLLAEGFKQHELLGKLFAQYYQTSVKPLLNSTRDIAGQIYLRSSDMQRTLLSTSTFINSFLQTSHITQPIDLPIHTMDQEVDYIFPNSHACPVLQQLKEELFASETFAELQKKYVDLRRRISIASGKDDITNIWPGQFFDCLMTAICADQWILLPDTMKPSWARDTAESLTADDSFADSKNNQSIVELTIAAVNEYATFQYTWKDGQISKAATAHLMVAIKAEIIRMLLKKVSEVHMPVESAEILSKLIGKIALQEFYQYIVSNQKRSSVQTPFDAKLLVVYGAHDTTLLAFLASLGEELFFGKWPSYASQLVFELYETASERFMFRLIYNGVSVTDRINGCGTKATANDLCDINIFFRATKWATPTQALATCGHPKLNLDSF